MSLNSTHNFLTICRSGSGLVQLLRLHWVQQAGIKVFPSWILTERYHRRIHSLASSGCWQNPVLVVVELRSQIPTLSWRLPLASGRSLSLILCCKWASYSVPIPFCAQNPPLLYLPSASFCQLERPWLLKAPVT